MPAVSVIARNLHEGTVETLTNGELRPVCLTCGYRGPRYNSADMQIAKLGIDAHIATVEGGGTKTWEIILYLPGRAPDLPSTFKWGWNWEAGEWFAPEVHLHPQVDRGLS